MSHHPTTSSQPELPRTLGHTAISIDALENTAKFACAAALGTPPEKIKVSINDDGGSLALRLTLPLPAPRLGVESTENVERAGNLWGQVNQAKGLVARQMAQLTGRAVSEVDLRITGVLLHSERRVQ